MKTIEIKGMSCKHCVAAVTKALNEIKGLSDVSVNLEKGEASFEKAASVDDSAIKAAVKRAGYEVV
ncbi:MAG: heavy-metal-associated domain-containing protein [Deltaproteobacteria bacterium]|nr:heavy-metal-associated domain-containing protein [Deltaproteobacteria bacterium]